MSTRVFSKTLPIIIFFNLISLYGICQYTGGSGSGFSTVTVQNTPLPVTLISFTGTWQKDNALLIWQTSTEINHSHFEIERSTDGNYFYYIGSINSAGSSAVTQDYKYTDFDIKENYTTLYYRLKSVDVGGKSIYSNIVILRAARNNQFACNVYPNPAQQYVIVAGPQDLINKQVTICLINSRGQIVQTKRMQNALERIELKNQPPGEYIVQLIGTDNINFSQKIVKTNQ